jgi:hypothetical protein
MSGTHIDPPTWSIRAGVTRTLAARSSTGRGASGTLVATAGSTGNHKYSSITTTTLRVTATTRFPDLLTKDARWTRAGALPALLSFGISRVKEGQLNRRAGSCNTNPTRQRGPRWRVGLVLQDPAP